MTWEVTSERNTRVRHLCNVATGVSSVTAWPKFRTSELETETFGDFQRYVEQTPAATPRSQIALITDYLLSDLEIRTFTAEPSRSSPTLEARRPNWWDAFETRLKSLRELTQNWNGYGAEPLVPAALDKAAELLATLADPSTPEPSVVPASKGGVQMEWHTLAGDLEIEVLPEGVLSILYANAETGVELEPQHVSRLDLKEFLRRL